MKNSKIHKLKPTNEEYTKKVEVEEYPNSPVVPLGAAVEDERGTIQNLLFTDIQSVAIITSKKGTVRSNHYHLTDWHYLYVIEGEMEYYERELHSPFNETLIVIKKGQMVFTPPMKVHKVVFTKNTTLLSCAKDKRTLKFHEKDCVKETF